MHTQLTDLSLLQAKILEPSVSTKHLREFSRKGLHLYIGQMFELSQISELMGLTLGSQVYKCTKFEG